MPSPIASKAAAGRCLPTRRCACAIPRPAELAAQGVSGEIEISAPSRFLGYFNNPDATRDAITADGFFRTGDIGRLRGDGAFVYETRAGDAMRLGGFLVAPGEIEDELKACTGVADAQVVAVDLRGQARCVAFVIPAGEPPQQEMLVARLRERLAGYKVPARIDIVDAFPVTDSANGVKSSAPGFAPWRWNGSPPNRPACFR